MNIDEVRAAIEKKTDGITLGKVIGKGGFSTVFDLSDGNVIKVIGFRADKTDEKLKPYQEIYQKDLKLDLLRDSKYFIKTIDKNRGNTEGITKPVLYYYSMKKYQCVGWHDDNEKIVFSSIINSWKKRYGKEDVALWIGECLIRAIIDMRNVYENVVHCDLKFQNLFVEMSATKNMYDNAVMVGDLGACHIQPKGHISTDAEEIAFTPCYAAPEIRMRLERGIDRIRWQTDAFSIGVMMYMIVSNENSFPLTYPDPPPLKLESVRRKWADSNPGKKPLGFGMLKTSIKNKKLKNIINNLLMFDINKRAAKYEKPEHLLEAIEDAQPNRPKKILQEAPSTKRYPEPERKKTSQNVTPPVRHRTNQTHMLQNTNPSVDMALKLMKSEDTNKYRSALGMLNNLSDSEQICRLRGICYTILHDYKNAKKQLKKSVKCAYGKPDGATWFFLMTVYRNKEDNKRVRYCMKKMADSSFQSPALEKFYLYTLYCLIEAGVYSRSINGKNSFKTLRCEFNGKKLKFDKESMYY